VTEGRTCTKCGEFKLASEFGKKRWTNKDGSVTESLRSMCNFCKNKSERARVKAPRNQTPEAKARVRERVAEWKRKRLANMTEDERKLHREKANAITKAWVKANPEKRKAQKLKHRGRDIERKRKYYQEHKEEISEKWKAYYQRKKKQLMARQKEYLADPAVQERLREYRRKVRAEDREKARQKIADLNDNYVKSVIRAGTGLRADQMSMALVEAKKLQLKIWRMVYEKR